VRIYDAAPARSLLARLLNLEENPIVAGVDGDNAAEIVMGMSARAPLLLEWIDRRLH
jgi:hypothetical protein